MHRHKSLLPSDAPRSPSLAKRRALWILLALLLPQLVTAADFALPDLDGKTIRLTDYRGKWVIVNFWASWCTPCLEELPALTAFQQAHGDRVQVLGINYEETSAEQIRAFLSKLTPTNFPHLVYHDAPEGLPASFFINEQGNTLPLQALPSSYFFDPQGRLLDLHIGPLSFEALEGKLRSLGN